MKSTLDTNIFLYATVSKSCANKVLDIYEHNKYNMVLRSVNEETKPKLLFLFAIFSTLKDESLKTKKIIKLIDSSFYNIFAVKYPQIYKTIRNHIINNKIDNRKKIQQFVETINSILNDIRYLIKIIDSNKRLYPSTVIDYETIKKSNLFKDSMNSLKKIIKNNDGDRKSLSLCNQFLTVNLKHNDKLTFITVDKDDFIKHGNKSNIETIIKGLIIEILPQLDVENIILKYD